MDRGNCKDSCIVGEAELRVGQNACAPLFVDVTARSNGARAPAVSFIITIV